jgi:hypothetical protein
LAKATSNAATKAACESAKAISNAAQKLACETHKSGEKAMCEAGKFAATQYCELTNVFNGDNIGPAEVNLFLRALNKDPMTPSLDNALPFVIIPFEGASKGGIDGELALLANTHLIVGSTQADHDNTGDDLNHVVLLLMAKLIHPSFISDNAAQQYVEQRALSFGSYLGAYYKKHGDDLKDYQSRIVAGIAAGWKPDVSPIVGVVRWYHRPNSGDGHANPQLSTLFAPIIDRLLH